AATSSVVQKSPYIVRVAQTLPQVTAPLAQWALSDEADIKSVITLVADYGPGHDTEKVFTKSFTEGGGQILDSLRIPLQNPDFAPFLQRAKDAKPDALFVVVPSGPGSTLLKQYASRGLADEGIRLIGTGILDDDQLPGAG